MNKVEHITDSLKENFDKLHQGILGKISEYDGNLKEVGSSVKAMDQVFKEVLPSLTESVNKLGRIANNGQNKNVQDQQNRQQQQPNSF